MNKSALDVSQLLAHTSAAAKSAQPARSGDESFAMVFNTQRENLNQSPERNIKQDEPRRPAENIRNSQEAKARQFTKPKQKTESKSPNEGGSASRDSQSIESNRNPELSSSEDGASKVQPKQPKTTTNTNVDQTQPVSSVIETTNASANQIIATLLQLSPEQLQDLSEAIEREFGNNEQTKPIVDAIQNLLANKGLLTALQHAKKGIGISQALKLDLSKMIDSGKLIEAPGQMKEQLAQFLADVKGFIEEHADFFASLVGDIKGDKSVNENNVTQATTDVMDTSTESTTQNNAAQDDTQQQENNKEPVLEKPVLVQAQKPEESKTIQGTEVSSELGVKVESPRVGNDFVNRAIEGARDQNGVSTIENKQNGLVSGIDRAGAAMQTQSVNARSQTNATTPSYFVEQRVSDPEWGNNFAQRVGMMLNSRLQQAEIRLNPPDLGPVTVRINLNNDQASIVFSAQHGVVREAIEAAMPKLRELLNDSGLTLANVDVNSQPQQRGDSAFTQTGQQGGGLFSDRDGANLEQDASALASEGEVTRRWSTERLLDLYA